MIVVYIGIVVCLYLLILGISYNIADYMSHVKMNKNENLTYDYVDFNTFLNEFTKYKDNPRIKYEDESIFLKDDNYDCIVYLHANIVEFDEKCMIFKPFSWFKYRSWFKKQCKNKNRVKGLWDN